MIYIAIAWLAGIAIFVELCIRAPIHDEWD
jgi:hypothetical protein